MRAIPNDESGATAIEYGLIAALIAIVIIIGVTIVGAHIRLTFNNVGNAANGVT